MVYEFSDFLAIDDGVSLEEILSSFNSFKYDESSTEFVLPIHEDKATYAFKMYDDGVRIKIQDTWYDVIPTSKLVRMESSDGYYRAIYIQINYRSGEYYIGKVNASNKRKLLSYPGSGVKFRAKYDKHKEQFVRYYICYCDTSEETERAEAKIVNRELLKDPFCLNCIVGGGKGISVDYSEERKQKQREYMKAHPERYKAMREAASNFSLMDIQRRGESIKKTMSDEKYKKMTSERIKNWIKNNPEAYALSRERNKEAMLNPDVQAKRAMDLKNGKTNIQKNLLYGKNTGRTHYLLQNSKRKEETHKNDG